MHLEVLLEQLDFSERLSTDLTGVWLFSNVDLFVPL